LNPSAEQNKARKFARPGDDRGFWFYVPASIISLKNYPVMAPTSIFPTSAAILWIKRTASLKMFSGVVSVRTPRALTVLGGTTNNACVPSENQFSRLVLHEQGTGCASKGRMV
jgi:hypothetical protein